MLEFALWLFMAAQQAQPVTQHSMDVAPIAVRVPASHPCNIAPQCGESVCPAVCITGPETRYVCADKSRVLLTAEDGSKHCIKFATQEPSSITWSSNNILLLQKADATTTTATTAVEVLCGSSYSH